jgi:hypothetical protein
VSPLLQNLIRVTPIPGEPVRFRQGNEVLVTVQFPRDFAISNLVEIKVADFVKGFLGSLFPMHRIEMPIDGIAEAQVLEAEKVEAVIADFVGLANNLRGLFRKALAE